MKNIVEYIDGFLKKKNIQWYNEEIFSVIAERYVKAIDPDFENYEMQQFRLRNAEGKIAPKQILVTDNLFLVFNVFGNKLEKDFSTEWRNHLLTIPELQEESFKKFVKGYLNTEDNFAQVLKENKKLQNVLANIDIESEKED